MSELTYEAIIAEINKTAESKPPVHNPYIYRYADIQIAIEVAMDIERERIIKLLEDRQRRTGDKYAGIANLDHRMIGIAIEEELGRTIALIKGENK